ncbi:MAG: hypothetical protein HKN16_02490 [Saprospiraceae bacterium]|nr:hypothetical protein [Saprospiraceae bacterium]
MIKYIITSLFLFLGLQTTVLAQCISGNCQEGKGAYLFKNNSARFVGSFQKGLPWGEGQCHFSNGDEYDGQWQAGKFHGKGALTLADGSTLDGRWTEGKFMGKSLPDQNRPEKSISQKERRTWALVVGVSDYHHMPVLRYADDDAYQFHNQLLASDGLSLSSDQVKLLINESATREKILEELTNIANQAGEEDIILFYFSGHGLKGSFLPFDYDGFNNQVFHNEINGRLKKSKAEHRICIADACHSGGIMAARSADSWISNWYPMLADAQIPMTFFLSSKSSERSLESKGLRMGVFSHFLIRGLKGEADMDLDQSVTLGELFQFVSKGVTEYTGHMQNPILAGEFDPSLILRPGK